MCMSFNFTFFKEMSNWKPTFRRPKSILIFPTCGKTCFSLNMMIQNSLQYLLLVSSGTKKERWLRYQSNEQVIGKIIKRWSNHHKHTMTSFFADVDQCVKCADNHFANREKNHCLQKAVNFLAHEDPLGMILISIALCFSALTVVVLGVFLKHKDTPIVKANNRSLSYILLITLTICFLCSLLFIGHPNTITCILQQTTFGGAFTVVLATVLAKAITVVIAFRVTFPGRVIRWLITSRAPNFIIPICSLIQLVLCGIWLATSPPYIEEDAHAEYGQIIIVCNKGSAVAFHCVLGYLCSLALGSYIMAFLSRDLPDTFNEAKFLSFSMLVFFCVWVTFLPVYHSTKGKVTVAMEVFSILASSAAILGFVFAPKCYIILIKPEKNSLHYMRERNHSRRNKPLKT